MKKLDMYINYLYIFAAYGGVKSTKSYQEDPKLFGYVMDLQRFEKILKEHIEKGYISVNEKELIGTDSIIFEI